MEYISESFLTPVRREADVVVAGGGTAGVAAALAAKRAGARDVILLERQHMLGGLATAGLVAIYLPLCDGLGRQVSFGISEELLRLSVSHGDEGRRPDAWFDGGSRADKEARRFDVQFNPQFFAMLCERLLLSEGVEIVYGVQVAAAHMQGGRLGALIVEGKSGREAIAARNFIDAMGDADLFKFCGARTALLGQGNILAGWYYYLAAGENRLKMLGAADVPEEYKRGEGENPGVRRYAGIETDEISAFMQASHAATLADFLSGGDIGHGRSLTTIATMPQLRMTRKIIGLSVPDDNAPYSDVEGSIGIVADWRRRGAAFALPYEALYGADVCNLAAAGRCISVTDSMWDITRVIPSCAVTGEAAGTAAALFDDFASANVKKLQSALKGGGVRISFDEV